MDNAQRYHGSAPSEIKHPVVLFDGVCKFCNGSVQFLLRHDKKDRLRFAALQSEYAHRLLPPELLDESYLDTMILAEGSTFYTRSTAVLRICKHLGGGWSLLYAAGIGIPRPLRDALYRFVAKYRYRLFGKYVRCMMPTEAVRRKFLDL
ncbi:hypothetical protein CF651_10885 [Paenibacillus rigui]|uniref:Thiol-disulfide oxidoreductase DCC n=2 Tax=Paenibacillus rigui TaxID=554312 RepID=A0A229USM7_9BACL|nr:hypothetical protein CF651_10885 [Paenibacillus rigui]